MKIIDNEEKLDEQGNSIMLYGRSKVGKTTSGLLYAPDPVMWIVTEVTRDVKQTLKNVKEISGRTVGKEIFVAYHEDFLSTLEFLINAENFKNVQSILLDSLTYLMNVLLVQEVVDEGFETKGEADKKKGKDIKDWTKVSAPNIGTVNQAIFRVNRALGQLTKSGKTLVTICGEDDSPRFDTALFAGPALAFKEVPTNIPYSYDYIGRITPRKDKDGLIIYPPNVSFEEGNGYLAGWTGGGGKNRSGTVEQFFKKFAKK